MAYAVVPQEIEGGQVSTKDLTMPPGSTLVGRSFHDEMNRHGRVTGYDEEKRAFRVTFEGGQSSYLEERKTWALEFEHEMTLNTFVVSSLDEAMVKIKNRPSMEQSALIRGMDPERMRITNAKQLWSKIESVRNKIESTKTRGKGAHEDAGRGELELSLTLKLALDKLPGSIGDLLLSR